MVSTHEPKGYVDLIMHNAFSSFPRAPEVLTVLVLFKSSRFKVFFES